MHELLFYVLKLESDKEGISYLLSAFMSSCEIELETTSVTFLFVCLLPSFWRFCNHYCVGKPLHIKGFPLQMKMLSLLVRPEICCSGHTSNTFFYEAVVWRARGVRTWVERYIFTEKDEGGKIYMESYYRGLPVWEADLRVNLFSYLTSLSLSKINRAPSSGAG